MHSVREVLPFCLSPREEFGAPVFDAKPRSKGIVPFLLLSCPPFNRVSSSLPWCCAWTTTFWCPLLTRRSVRKGSVPIVNRLGGTIYGSKAQELVHKHKSQIREQQCFLTQGVLFRKPARAFNYHAGNMKPREGEGREPCPNSGSTPGFAILLRGKQTLQVDVQHALLTTVQRESSFFRLCPLLLGRTGCFACTPRRKDASAERRKRERCCGLFCLLFSVSSSFSPTRFFFFVSESFYAYVRCT